MTFARMRSKVSHMSNHLQVSKSLPVSCLRNKIPRHLENCSHRRREQNDHVRFGRLFVTFTTILLLMLFTKSPHNFLA